MTRLKNTILGPQAFGEFAQAPMVDLRNGPQNGPVTDFVSYVSNTAYVRRQMVAVLVEAPTGFQLLPNPDVWVGTLKALVELHPKSITGLNATLTVETLENAVGGAGEVQEDYTNVTRARSQPVFDWTEKYGFAIGTFLQAWIRNLIMDETSKVPAIVANGNTLPGDLLPDVYAMTCLFFEPDPTFTKVVKAYLCTNMYPKSSGAVESRREMAAAGDGVDHSIEFTALTQVGYGVIAFAQEYLDQMNLTGLNPNTQAAFVQRVTADVRASNTGYGDMLDQEAVNRV